MAIVEDYFPRGSKGKGDKKVVAHYEKKRKNDSLFKDPAEKKKKKRVKKFKTGKDLDDAIEPLSKKEKKKAEKAKTALDSIEPFTYKMLSEGMHLLGKIQEVRDMDILLSLPGRLQAVVPITNISTPYSKLLDRLAHNEDVEVKGLKDFLKEGQLFPCTIKEVTNDGSFKVTASLNPADLCNDIPLTALSKGMKLTAAVQSIEDHGYVMDVGMANVRSFLAKEPELDLAVGQILTVCVTDCKVDGIVATLTLSTKTTVKFKQNVEFNIATLIPGTKLHTHVTKVTPHGLMVSFGNLVGYIHKDHLAKTFDDMTSYTKSSNQVAVVLYTVPLVNAVYLSLKPSLVDPETIAASSQEPLALGTIIDNATVLESTTAGLFVQLNKGAKGFIPLRHLSDKLDVLDDVKALHPAKSRKRCRILQHSSLDDVYICTMKKSLLEQKALRYEDFTVGEVVEGKVEAVHASGVSVRLGANLNGFIPKLHWADDPRLKRPELRFRPGATVTCRVLKVFPDRKSVHLTCKKTLVEDTGPTYSHPSQVSPNLALKGTVTLVEKGGVMVTFYGELNGWIPKNKLTKKGIADIGRYFYVGQLIDCTVNYVLETGKVTLSLGKPESPTEAPVETKQAKKRVKDLGTVVQCRVEKIFPAGQESSSGLEVSVPTLKIKGFIPVDHLSDFPQIGPSLLQSYRVGQTIDEAVVWSSSKLQTVLTLKRSIINAAAETRFPKSAQEVEEGDVYPCVSMRHQSFGVFAKLLCPPSQCDVLFPKSKMPEALYAAAKKDTLQHLTLEGKVISVDQEQKKISLSALDADVPLCSDQVLDAYFKDVEKIRTAMLESPDEKLKHLAGLKFGDSVIARLSSEFDPAADIEFELPHGLKGVVPAYHHAQKAFKKNDLIAGCVLYSDLIQQKVYVTTRDDVLAHIASMETLAPKGCKLKATILLHQDYFSLVSVQGKVPDIAYVSNVRNFNDAVALRTPPYPVGEEVVVMITTTACGKVATYHKPPKAWAVAKPQKSKRANATQQDGPAKKKAKTAESAPAAKVEPSAAKPKAKDRKEESTASAKPAEKSKKKKEKAAKINPIETVPAAKSVEGKTKAPTPSRPIVDEAANVEDVSPPKKIRAATSVAKKSPFELPRLSVNAAFKWDDDTVAPAPTIPDSSDSEDEDAQPEKAVVKDRRERARQKLEEARLEEAKLSQIEESLNDPDRTPVSADDFDRLVLASPNSSILWLQYMAFHLENAEFEKARTVAQRALKVISFREEQEKFNVWIAWLNLEHMYGTTESYDEAFQEALRYNEPFKVYRQMALNFEQNGKPDEAESLHSTMLKKFKQDKSVWLGACLFYVRQSKLDTARQVFQRALSVLDKKEHIDLISRFAQLEVKFGQLERGKTLFDTLMQSYPKRTDLWLVYVDTLTKAGDVESARQVLERCITLQLPAKKMKTIFQKFLEFETHHGGPERQDYVRQKALDYVESKTDNEAPTNDSA